MQKLLTHTHTMEQLSAGSIQHAQLPEGLNAGERWSASCRRPGTNQRSEEELIACQEPDLNSELSNRRCSRCMDVTTPSTS